MSFFKPVVTAIYGCSVTTLSGPFGKDISHLSVLCTTQYISTVVHSCRFLIKVLLLNCFTDCSRMGGDIITIFGQHFGASGSSVIIGSQVGLNY